MMMRVLQRLAVAGAVVVVAACGSDDGDDGGGAASSAETTAGTGGEAGSGGGGTGGGTATAGAGGDSGGTGGGDGAGGGAGGGAACSGDEGDPVACTGVCPAGTTCRVEGDFKLGVLEEVHLCLNALDSATCTVTDAAACGVDALSGACADPSADDDCAMLADLCTQTEPVCHAILDGLTEAGRGVVIDCVEAFCTSAEFALEDCVTDLFIF